MVDLDVARINGDQGPQRPQYSEAPWYPTLLSCTACPCRQEARRVVPGSGPIDGLLMIVGQNPGQEEDERGVPFVGLSGDELAVWLSTMCLGRDRLILTNIVKCHTERNRVPRPKEIAVCQDRWLRQELETFTSVKVIMTLGRPALFGLVGKVSPLPDVLDVWWMTAALSETRSVEIIPMPHPSYLLRMAGARERFHQHVLPGVLHRLKTEWPDVYEHTRTRP